MTALIITLIVVGLVLLIVELILVPGFGVAGILGVASLVASCWLGFSQSGTETGMLILAVEIVLVVLITVMVLRSKTWKKASLDASISSRVDLSPQEKGIGMSDRGIAVTRLAPAGQVKIGVILTEAFARDAVIEAGTQIEVTEIQDNKIYVKVVEE